MANPILNDKFYQNESVITGETMTVNGTLQVTAYMGVLLFISAAFVWSRYTLGYTDMAAALMGGGVIVGFILALIISFTRKKFLVPVYAVCEGFALGGISAIMESSYPGIVSQAVLATFATFFAMLGLYRFGLIKCTDKFRGVIFTATLSIVLVYLVDWIGHFFGYSVPALNTSSNLGLIISGVIVLVAALNLIIDFDFIEKGAMRMLPKDYEWYGAFGLMVTLVWLYIEILKLIANTRRR